MQRHYINRLIDASRMEFKKCVGALCKREKITTKIADAIRSYR